MRIFKDNLSTFSHWFAWTMALLASVFFGIYLFSEDIPKLISSNNTESGFIWFVVFILIAMAGTIFSLWNRLYGGIAMLAGGIGIVMYFYFLSGWLDSNLMFVYGLPYILPGILLLIVKK
jgi:hypothetical protein